ncbi:TM1802 family CRISPR-associated protein [Aneurinibacillus sp. UBA3580]|jgi:CRISPR-associated protein Csh1|uniref:TM1802 family CRISPR-associated protein n=1 Tax=Aneurinibacillus sp. UBA3580 TaxID=1946041 RepID=UPI00257E5EDB|nr:TM1802 family CRISPR-associated protein [Aneurinibacillus sp. UBA3580]
MNLPQITAQIGQMESQNENELHSLVKKLKFKPKAGESAYAVYMTFDLQTQDIIFEAPMKVSEDLLYRIHYFGNNAAAAAQTYMVRETDSLNYLLTSVWNDFHLSLKQNGFADCELTHLIEEVQKAGLISVSEKKGEGNVSFNRLRLPFISALSDIRIDKQKKAVIIDGTEYKYEAFIRLFIADDNKKNRIVLIIPRIRNVSGEEIVLSTHQDYIQLVKKLNNLEKSETEHQVDDTALRICYVCQQNKPNVSSEYTKKFSRSGINKIFITQKTNMAPFFEKKRYDDNYSICLDCYQQLLAGEKLIEKTFKGRIARENAYILPESLMGTFNYKYISTLKENVDLAFNQEDAQKFLDKVQAEAEADFDHALYMLHFFIYRTDGNSVTVLDVIEDVPVLRFHKIMNEFAEIVSLMSDHLRRMSLATVYRIVPVRETPKGQIDIGRVLTLYKSILSGQLIDKKTLYSYASEALDKGLKQLAKSRPDNYYNMGLGYYTNGREDFFIKRIIMSYLALFRLCERLDILNRTLFAINEGGESTVTVEQLPSKTKESIEKMEKFLSEQKFSREAKGLFYLGTLIHRVATAQYIKEHRKKPILKKIQFQGMKQREVIRLYEDVLEKLRQYNRFTSFSETLLSRFHEYYGNQKEDKYFDEHENVFYIMSGYAYMVGQKAPDFTKQEEEAQLEESTPAEEE